MKKKNRGTVLYMNKKKKTRLNQGNRKYNELIK